MNICVIGANGQLGVDICKELEHEFNVIPLTHEDISIEDSEKCREVLTAKFNMIPLTHEDISIEDSEKCREVLTANKPNVVINTAAYHHVEKCETNGMLATQINVIGCTNLAKICEELNAQLIHISTDYVFDGEKNSPYVETDLVNPLQVYGQSKALGEKAVATYCKNHKILRVSGIYGLTPCRAKGGNFIDTMLRLAKNRDEITVVDDEILTPTSTTEIAKQIKVLIDSPEVGIFHVTNHGQCSWYEFACKIFEIIGNKKIKIVPVPATTFPTSFDRPKYSVLENERLKKLDLDIMNHWEDALKTHLKEKLKN